MNILENNDDLKDDFNSINYVVDINLELLLKH